jgi:hypothetical protein
MDEARYLRRGTLLFTPLAFFTLLLTAIHVGAGNMISGVPGNVTSPLLAAGFVFSSSFCVSKWR